MGNEKIGQAHFLLQLQHQVEDLGLHAHVQRGNGLVHHDELGLEDQRPGDADALSAAAVQFVGIGGGQALFQAH